MATSLSLLQSVTLKISSSEIILKGRLVYDSARDLEYALLLTRMSLYGRGTTWVRLRGTW